MGYSTPSVLSSILFLLPSTPSGISQQPRASTFSLSIPRTNLLPKQVKNDRFTHHNAQGDNR